MTAMRMQIASTLKEVLNVSVSQVTQEMEKTVKVEIDIINCDHH